MMVKCWYIFVTYLVDEEYQSAPETRKIFARNKS